MTHQQIETFQEALTIFPFHSSTKILDELSYLSFPNAILAPIPPKAIPNAANAIAT